MVPATHTRKKVCFNCQLSFVFFDSLFEIKHNDCMMLFCMQQYIYLVFNGRIKHKVSSVLYIYQRFDGSLLFCVVCVCNFCTQMAFVTETGSHSVCFNFFLMVGLILYVTTTSSSITTT